MAQDQMITAKEFLAAFASGAPIQELMAIIKEGDYFDLPAFEEIQMEQSIKYLYGNESLVLKLKWFPLLRIAGDSGFYRIMTPTTGEGEKIPKSILEDILNCSELFGKLLNVNLLRLEDRQQRPFNVFGEFTWSPYDNEQTLKELTWVFSIICFNEAIFKELALFPKSKSTTLPKSINVQVASKPWANEKIRVAESAKEERQVLYKTLSNDEDEYVYLMDGCWLSPSGEIIDKR